MVLIKMGYKIEVDEETCIGCGSCEHVSEGLFEVIEKDDKFVAVSKKNFVDEISGELNEAKDICPVGAIKITESESSETENTESKKEIKLEAEQKQN